MFELFTKEIEGDLKREVFSAKEKAQAAVGDD